MQTRNLLPPEMLLVDADMGRNVLGRNKYDCLNLGRMGAEDKAIEVLDDEDGLVEQTLDWEEVQEAEEAAEAEMEAFSDCGY